MKYLAYPLKIGYWYIKSAVSSIELQWFHLNIGGQYSCANIVCLSGQHDTYQRPILLGNNYNPSSYTHLHPL